MKLSIITVNLNNAEGLQKTMESVFAQTFSDYEYLIIDGDSTDGSKELIKKHQNELGYWVSEKDEGIYSAMNKGIVKARGEYLLFLNSGDYLFTNFSLFELFQDSEDEDIVYGNVYVIDEEKKWIKTYPSKLSFSFFLGDSLHHQSCIIKRHLFDKLGLYNTEFKIISDWEFCMNAICLHRASYKYLDSCVSVFRRDGFSSLLDNVELFKKERAAVIYKTYQAFIPDYDKAAKTKLELEECKSSLNNINNSRLYKFVKRTANNSFIRIIRNLF
ncbi:MAG: glycosyltransferase [Bacteroidota bacterium]|nr:glycosyltransferase [Bacteroidota bacterium]